MRFNHFAPLMGFTQALKAARPAALATVAVLALLTALAPTRVLAAESDVQDAQPWSLHLQATYVSQVQRPFEAAYTGPRSLAASAAQSYSFTTTAMLGWRPWAGGELYADAEAAQGVALSGLTGLGAYSNGEITRTAGPSLTLYRARLFLRQTWALGEGAQANAAQEPVAPAAHQLGGSVPRERLVLTVGNLSVQDVFDGNAYAHDPRTQFLNVALMTHGAYDYAADTRGYTWGAALEWFHGDWVLRAGRFQQPVAPNQQALDARVLAHYGDQLELEHAHTLAGQPGRLRLLLFRNRTRMARYDDALDQAAHTGSVPNIDTARAGEQVKWGAGLNLEQAVTDTVGVFARAAWADGQTETYAFTEIDRSQSAGVLLAGAAWGRAQDSLGLALARNGLSAAHRAYLAAGGLGFFIGDGRLNYQPETVLEAFYSLGLVPGVWATLDVQRIANPAYNADRGPVRLAALRLHTEF